MVPLKNLMPISASRKKEQFLIEMETGGGLKSSEHAPVVITGCLEVTAAYTQEGNL